MVAETVPLDTGIARFSSDSQLLSELGERLIADPVIALAGLIKNVYDADATEANVYLESGPDPVLIVRDNGHGMSKDDFLNYWMIVGTPAKLGAEKSRRFHRPLTGSKGVGRFAVRLLGKSLHLESVSFDASVKEWRRLVADFEWGKFASGSDLGTVSVPYKIYREANKAEAGTRLSIGTLRDKWSDSDLALVTQDVLDIVEPPFPLTSGPAKTSQGAADPGFSLFFSPPGQGERATQAADELVERWQARMLITVAGTAAQYQCFYKDQKGKPKQWTVSLDKNLVGDVTAELRDFPRRAGMFSNMTNMDGRDVISYLRKRGGVRIIDRGFRIRPYGEPDDDWLGLSRSKARNERRWNSPYTEVLYPRAKLPREESLDPLLKLPANHQLLGTVCVESFRSDQSKGVNSDSDRLQPVMDRQGFVDNAGFNQLSRLIRTATELIAVVDREQGVKRDKDREARVTREVQVKIDTAIERVQKSREIAPKEKRAIVESYREIQSAVAVSAQAHGQTLRAVEAMSLLGVLAGFMTHETTVMQRASEEMIKALRAIPARNRPVGYDTLLSRVEEANREFKSHIEYARLFLTNIHEREVRPYPVRPQVKRVLDHFKSFMDARSIRGENTVSTDERSPAIGVGVYSGILLNLFTNALKAVVKVDNRERLIQVSAESTPQGHKLRVSDTGVGIPLELQGLIFEPFITTTGDEGPLGSGMGLGLHIVRRVLDSIGGRIELVDPPDGFVTCFEVTFQNAK